jgi:CheY-like chemotaxis protein
MKKNRVMLLVEDNNDDALLLQRVVSRADLGLDLHRVHNGQEAIDYLLGEDQFADRKQHPNPDVIMLDLKMPICDGFDFLDWKRGQPSWSALPTIVMTSSDLPRDIRRSYQLGAHSFTMKVKTTDSMSRRVEALRHWWFEHCVLPQDVSAESSALSTGKTVTKN